MAKVIVGHVLKKDLDEYEILNIIERESKLDPDFHGIVMRKIAKAIHDEMCKLREEK